MDINYNGIQQIAYSILKEHGGSIPINPFYVVNQMKNLTISNYDDFSYIQGIPQEKLIAQYGTDEGFLRCFHYKNGERQYLLCYNQKKTKARIRWTIGHELGHYFLNHHTLSKNDILNSDTLGKEKNEIFEKEANHFAKHLLAPFPVVLLLKEKLDGISKSTISKIFQINYQPAGYIHENINKLGRAAYNYEDAVLLRKFGASLTSILSGKYCSVCKTEFSGKGLKHCPICGNKDILIFNKTNCEKYLFSKETIVRYSKINLDKYNKVLACQVCGNTDIPLGDHCQICGSIIVNRCTNTYSPCRDDYDEACGKLLDGDARFCTHCGSESTFYNKGYLKAYCDDDLVIPDDVPF